MVPRLDIKHLTVLAALATTGSVTAAAAQLGVTQSAVSHRLREAERRLGAPLVERGERGVQLTADGERMRALAERFLRELMRVEQEIETERSAGQRLLRLGQATFSRYHWLPAFLDHLAESEPDLSVDLSGSATLQPFAALNDGSADVVTVYGRPPGSGRYRWQKLGTDPLVAAVAPTHRLAERPYLETEDIAEERFFSYPLSAEPGFEWEALIGAPSVPFRRVTRMPTPEAVIDLVRAGFGSGVFSRWALEPEVADGTLVARPLTAEGTLIDWWAVTRGDEPENAPAARLARALLRWSSRYETAMQTLGFEGDGG